MAYQNVGTPRFYVNILEYLGAIGYTEIEDVYRTNPTSIKPSGQTITTPTPEGIFGGDTYICRYGAVTALKPSNHKEDSNPKKSIQYHIVESTDNINFRHQVDDKSQYFPQGVAKDILRNAGALDYSFVDNMTWVRFSIDAGTEETYNSVRRAKGNQGWDKMLDNLSKLISTNKKKGKKMKKGNKKKKK